MSTQTMEPNEGTPIRYGVIFVVLAIFTALEVFVAHCFQHRLFSRNDRQH